MYDLALNLLASVVAGVAVWLAQRLLRYRSLSRRRSFFGISAKDTCLLVAPKHASSPHRNSVHRQDVAALVELAAIAKDCGAQAELTAVGAATSVGRTTEFCVGGPSVNERMAVHLRNLLPGVTLAPFTEVGEALTMYVGDEAFAREPGQTEYVLLAKVFGPQTPHPVFLVSGQTAPTNKAAARFLATHYRELIRRYGVDGRFCLVLRVVEPASYGTDFSELAADMTATAFTPPADQPAELAQVAE